ncbi:hypothetical protein GCM10009771_11980 [Nesterenkonia flava]
MMPQQWNALARWWCPHMRSFIYTRNAAPNIAQRHQHYKQCKTIAEEHQHEVIGTAHDDGCERSGLATLIEGLG